tara:strand:+ start:5910 stop:6446 length:537 start_codon:yes stop_codon:yes gene_type:complete
MRYGFDIDGVVCDIMPDMRRVADDCGIDISDHDLMIDYGNAPEQIEDCLTNTEFWMRLKPLRASWHVINHMFSQGADVFFITSRKKPEAIDVTEEWLDSWSFSFTKFLSTKREGLKKEELYKELDLDLFVDDHPMVASAVSLVGNSYLYSTEYNANYDLDGVVRIERLKELYKEGVKV